MNVGERIRTLREQKNITVNKLANLSGVSQSYLRDLELGNKQPTVEYLEYICYGLGITLKDFFESEDKEEPLNAAISKLNSTQKKLLADFLNSL